MFAEAAVGILQVRVEKEGLTRLGTDIGDNLLDCLHEASLRITSFRKAYVELIVRIFITGNDGLAKRCLGIIVNDLYKKKYFRCKINSAMGNLMSLVACTETSKAKYSSDYSMPVMRLRICKYYLLLCVRSVEL